MNESSVSSSSPTHPALFPHESVETLCLMNVGELQPGVTKPLEWPDGSLNADCCLSLVCCFSFWLRSLTSLQKRLQFWLRLEAARPQVSISLLLQVLPGPPAALLPFISVQRGCSGLCWRSHLQALLSCLLGAAASQQEGGWFKPRLGGLRCGFSVFSVRLLGSLQVATYLMVCVRASLFTPTCGCLPQTCRRPCSLISERAERLQATNKTPSAACTYT